MEPLYGRLIPECERLGVSEVRRMRLQNEFHSLDLDDVDKWLLLKEGESKDRAEERAEESLTISRKALSNSRLATSIAIGAIVLSLLMAIQRLIEWFSTSSDLGSIWAG